MNIDPTIYGYIYRAALYCPNCVLEVLINQGKASPAARDLGAEATIEQVIEADAATWPETHDSDSYPQRIGAYDSLTVEDLCGVCHERLLD